MDVNGELIRLDPLADGVLYEPRDWQCAGFQLMRHKPTHSIFEIRQNDDVRPEDRVTLFQFSARLVHVCDGYEVPSSADQVPLGRAAIAIFLQEVGVWKPKVDYMPYRPCRHRKPREPRHE